MSDWKEHLEEFLASEEASASGLDAGARETAMRILLQASGSNESEALLHEMEQRYPVRARGGSLLPKRAYLRGRLLLELERSGEALETLLPLCEKLEQQEQLHDLAATADEILGITASVDAARYLAKAIEEGGADVAPAGSLRRALELFPDEHRICWLAASEFEGQGETERALGLFTGCLPALIDVKALDRIEEIFIRLEDLDDTETVATMLQACVKLATAKEWKVAETYLEPLLPKIRKAGLVGSAWDLFLKLLPKAPTESNLRRFIMEIAAEALPGVDGVLDLLARSGILDPKVKAPGALHKLKQLLELAPGYRVLHHNWGVGRIRSNEGDALIIDFPDRAGHRMSLSIARSALTVIPPDDLRALWTEKPDQVREMVRAKPADVAYLAIRELNGRATTQELRRRLTAEIIPTTRWSTWWKEARTAMEQDERFDLSEGFRQAYAIRSGPGHDEDLILPRMDRRRGIRANLNLLRRFLEQHPQHKDRAVKMYTPVLVRWLHDEKTHPDAALAICLLLDRWQRLDPKDLEQSLRTVLSRGVEASAFANISDQRLLVSNALKLSGLDREAILFALGSRYPEIREVGVAKLREDPVRGETTLMELLSRPEERPHTALGVIMMLIAEDTQRESFHPPIWRAASSLCRLIERTGKDALRNQVTRLFSPRSSLAEALRREPPAEEIVLSLGKELTRWRESERFLFPILEFFEEIGLTEMVQTVRQERSAATNRLIVSQRHGGGIYTGFYMTRATYERLERERRQLRHDLKFTIPEIIDRARALGDLSENAEYDAAKDKQADYTHRVTEIDRMLSQATPIETVQVPAGDVGPGSWIEVRLLNSDLDEAARTHTYWLLGEGDSRFGEEVVSCSAPIGRSLLGKKVGEQVPLDLPEGLVQVEILSAEQKFPQNEPAEQS
jgi:transcription elongation factor GreA